jgi:hypothetical protein
MEPNFYVFYCLRKVHSRVMVLLAMAAKLSLGGKDTIAISMCMVCSTEAICSLKYVRCDGLLFNLLLCMICHSNGLNVKLRIYNVAMDLVQSVVRRLLIIRMWKDLVRSFHWNI